MTLKKTLSSKIKNLGRILALSAVFQAGCEAFNSNSETHQKQNELTLLDLSPVERETINCFIQDYSERSPAAKKVFQELNQQGARFEFYDENPDEKGLFWAGRSSEDVLSINRKIVENGVSFPNTFFHEAEHVIHLKRAHQQGINAHSFSSLNDVYVYATLLEALAYRKAALCCSEYGNKDKTPKEISAHAESIFRERLTTKNKELDERFSYEEDAIKMANSETNTLPNQVYFPSKVDWNHVVSVLSRGEVKKVPVMPQPTLLFLNVCLYRELEKHPKAEKLDDLDISCLLKNRSELQKDDKGIKENLSNFLINIFNICQKKERQLSNETKGQFLYLIGWPTAKQQQQIDQGKTDVKSVYDSNLARFDTAVLFNSAEKLLQSPEVSAYRDPEIELYRKMIHFEKMILLPQKTSEMKMKKEKTR